MIGPHRQAAEVIGFRDGRALLMGLSPLKGVFPGVAVVTEGLAAAADTGPALLGRLIDGLGRPLDGRGRIAAGRPMPLKARTLAPGDRARVTEPLATGVRAIDGLLTFGRGQRVGIMAGTGVGKSVLLGQIARWAAADVVIMALIGERGREITDFVETELVGEAAGRIITLAVPADEAPLAARARGGAGLCHCRGLSRAGGACAADPRQPEPRRSRRAGSGAGARRKRRRTRRAAFGAATDCPAGRTRRRRPPDRRGHHPDCHRAGRRR